MILPSVYNKDGSFNYKEACRQEKHNDIVIARRIYTKKDIIDEPNWDCFYNRFFVRLIDFGTQTKPHTNDHLIYQLIKGDWLAYNNFMLWVEDNIPYQDKIENFMINEFLSEDEQKELSSYNNDSDKDFETYIDLLNYHKEHHFTEAIEKYYQIQWLTYERLIKYYL